MREQRAWLNNRIDFGKFFWDEALHLSKWAIDVVPPSDEIFVNIELVASKLELISKLYDKAILISSWYRPEEYNHLIGGAKNSAHTEGKAIDFNIVDVHPDEIRTFLKDKLDYYGIRMENLPGSSWVHIDVRDPVGGARFFKP